MIKLPDDITNEDVTQWLGGGVFIYRPQYPPNIDMLKSCVGNGYIIKDQYLAKFHHGWMPESHNAGVKYRLQLDDGVDTYAYTAKDFYAQWPTCGAINLPEVRGAVSIMRTQKKQWRRTFVETCAEMSVTGARLFYPGPGDDIYKLGLRSWIVLNNLFNPKYPTGYFDLLGKLNAERWRTCALNPLMILGKRDHDILIYVDGRMVGKLRDENDPMSFVGSDARLGNKVVSLLTRGL